MKRSTIMARAALLAALACAGAAAAAQTPITRLLPAIKITLKKSDIAKVDNPKADVSKMEIYNVDDLNARVSKIEKAWLSRINPATSAEDREKARIELVASIKPKLLDAQINAMLFKLFCDVEGITVSDPEVEQFIPSLKAQNGVAGIDDQTFEQLLIVSGGLLVDLRTAARQRLLLIRYIQGKRGDELKALKGPTPDEILAAYAELKPNFKMPETARVSMVFIEGRGKSAEERQKARETMRGLAARIKDDKSQFDKLLLGALDPQAGYLARPSITIPNVKGEKASLDPKFVDAVFGLKPGEISDVLENDEGLQIVRLNEISPARQLELYDPIPGQQSMSVQDLVAQQLVGMAQEDFAAKVQAEVLANLRGKASVTIMKDNLRGVMGDDELDGIAARYAKKER